MKLHIRFSGKAPIDVENVERFEIHIDGREYEIRRGQLAPKSLHGLLTIRGEAPIHEGLIVVPVATNTIHIGRAYLSTLPLERKPPR